MCRNGYAINGSVGYVLGSVKPGNSGVTTMAESMFREIKFTDNDIANIDDWIPAGEYNPHNVRPFLLHNYGFVVAIVFASCLQDALDVAVDKNKLDGYQISDDDIKDYENEEGVTFLGNASEPFDIEGLGIEELPNPPRSFCVAFNAMQNETPKQPPRYGPEFR